MNILKRYLIFSDSARKCKMLSCAFVESREAINNVTKFFQRRNLFLLLCVGVVICFFVVTMVKKNHINVVIITVDSLRSDFLGCYGYSQDTSPHIDAWARKAVIFSQAISQGSQTFISNSSLVTSTYPNTHQVLSPLDQLRPDLSTITSVLKSNGYITALVSDQIALNWIIGLNKSFDNFDIFSSAPDTSRLSRNTKFIDPGKRAIAWLKNNKDKKFFLWVYYFGSHALYLPVAPYNKLFNEVPILGDDSLSFCKEKDWNGNGCIPLFFKLEGKTSKSYYISQYAGAIRQTDDSIGALLQELKKMGLDKNTLIVINADHGEAMGEHDQYFCHGIFLYDNLIKVPLIIKAPDSTVHIQRIDQQVRVIDVVPTIFDFIGIKTPVAMQGISLKPLMRGEDFVSPRFSFSQTPDKVSVRMEGWKLIFNSTSGSYEIYNLKNDPSELENLIGQEGTPENILKGELKAYFRATVASKSKRLLVIPEDFKQKMKSLGYAQ